jgi:hypothetical protein
VYSIAARHNAQTLISLDKGVAGKVARRVLADCGLRFGLPTVLCVFPHEVFPMANPRPKRRSPADSASAKYARAAVARANRIAERYCGKDTAAQMQFFAAAAAAFGVRPR